MSVDPGEGYRLLRRWEVKELGDEYWHARDKCWVETLHWGYKYNPESDAPLRRKRQLVDDRLDRIRTAMQNHPNWAEILFGELTEPLRTDLKLVLEHYLGDSHE